MVTTLICGNMTSVVQSLQCIGTMGTYNGYPLLGIILIALIWITVFWRGKDPSAEGTKNALVSASWFSFISSVLLGIIGLLGSYWIALFIVLTIGGLVFIINRNY